MNDNVNEVRHVETTALNQEQAGEFDFDTLDIAELTQVSGGAISVEKRPSGGKK